MKDDTNSSLFIGFVVLAVGCVALTGCATKVDMPVCTEMYNPSALGRTVWSSKPSCIEHRYPPKEPGFIEKLADTTVDVASGEWTKRVKEIWK